MIVISTGTVEVCTTSAIVSVTNICYSDKVFCFFFRTRKRMGFAQRLLNSLSSSVVGSNWAAFMLE